MTDTQFEARNVVITGGAGGIGAACARSFVNDGAHVFLLDLPGDNLDSIHSNLRPLGQVSALPTNVADRASVEAAFAHVADQGGTDILVTTAAVVKGSPILDFDPEDWDRILQINLTGTFHCCQLAARQMTAKGWGRIVTLSSINGQVANSGRGAYACTKSGVDMLTKLLAAELGDKGITANAVAPAPVDTPMILDLHGPKDRAVWEAQIPAKRYARPEEVAAAVRFLASKEAGYINGHILNLDGGFMASGILLR